MTPSPTPALDIPVPETAHYPSVPAQAGLFDVTPIASDEEESADSDEHVSARSIYVAPDPNVYPRPRDLRLAAGSLEPGRRFDLPAIRSLLLAAAARISLATSEDP